VAGRVVEGALVEEQAVVVAELAEEGQVELAEELEVVPVQAVELEPGLAVAAALELAAVRVQGQALAPVREPRSVLAQMHP